MGLSSHHRRNCTVSARGDFVSVSLKLTPKSNNVPVQTKKILDDLIVDMPWPGIVV